MLLGHSSGELQHPLYAFSFAIGILFLSLRVECCHLFGHFTMQTLFWVYRRCKVYCCVFALDQTNYSWWLEWEISNGFLNFLRIFIIKHTKMKNTEIVWLHIQLHFYGSWQYIRQISCFYIECEISNEF